MRIFGQDDRMNRITKQTVEAFVNITVNPIVNNCVNNCVNSIFPAIEV